MSFTPSGLESTAVRPWRADATRRTLVPRALHDHAWARGGLPGKPPNRLPASRKRLADDQTTPTELSSADTPATTVMTESDPAAAVDGRADQQAGRAAEDRADSSIAPGTSRLVRA
jgi:hypothetical protein